MARQKGGIDIGSMLEMTSPVAFLANGEFATEADLLAPDQLRHESWPLRVAATNARYYIKPMAQCLLANGNPVTAATWGTRLEHYDTLGAAAGGGSSTPAAPDVAFDPATRILSYTHALGSSELEVSQNHGAYQPYAPLSIDDNAHAAGEWKARVKAYVAGNRNASQPTPSPAIAAKDTLSLTSATPTMGGQARRVLLQGQNFGAAQGASTLKIGAVNFDVLGWSNTAIYAAVPAGAPAGTGTISLTVGGTTVSTSFAVPVLSTGYTGAKEVLVVPFGDSQSAEFGLQAGQGHLQQINATWGVLDNNMSMYLAVPAVATCISGATTTQIRNFFSTRVLSVMSDAVGSGGYDGTLIMGLIGVNNLTFALRDGYTLPQALAKAKEDIEWMYRQALALAACGGALIITQTNTASYTNIEDNPGATPELIQPYVVQLRDWVVTFAAALQAELGKPVRVAQNHLISELTEPATDRDYFQDDVHPAARGQVLMAANERPILEQIAQEVYNVDAPAFEFAWADLQNSYLPLPGVVEIMDDKKYLYYQAGAVSNFDAGPVANDVLLHSYVVFDYHQSDDGFQLGLNNQPIPRVRTGPGTSANIKWAWFPQSGSATASIWTGSFTPSGSPTITPAEGWKLRVQVQRDNPGELWDIVFLANGTEVWRIENVTLPDIIYADVSLPGGGAVSRVRGAQFWAANPVART